MGSIQNIQGIKLRFDGKGIRCRLFIRTVRNVYGETPPNGHLGNTVTSLLWPLLQVA